MSFCIFWQMIPMFIWQEKQQKEDWFSPIIKVRELMPLNCKSLSHQLCNPHPFEVFCEYMLFFWGGWYYCFIELRELVKTLEFLRGSFQRLQVGDKKCDFGACWSIVLKPKRKLQKMQIKQWWHIGRWWARAEGQDVTLLLLFSNP